jgi:hypothetical protein
MLDRDAVAAALAGFVSDQDYDLHKEIEADGEAGYPTLAEGFVRAYEAELARRTVTPGRLVVRGHGRVLSLAEFRELTAAVPGSSRLVLELYGPAGGRETVRNARAVGIDVDGTVVVEAGNRRG